MPISYSEYTNLTCPNCGAGFEADVWALVDAAERSDLAQALRDGALNIVICPKCSTNVQADTALLFHDPASRRVYFAVPPNAEEHALRERAQELLYLLVSNLPEEERRPYLSDVQVEQELDGVRRAVLRNDRRRGARARPGDKETGGQGGRETRRPGDKETADPPASSSPLPPVSAAPPPTESIIATVRALLAADSDEDFAAMIAANPQLLSDNADTIVRQLADQAYEGGDRTMATALRELRVTLTSARSGQGFTTSSTRETAPPQPVDAPNAQSIESPIGTREPQLSDAAYQALLHVAGPADLLAAVRDYPALLEEWADADLAARSEAALDEGNERLARTIEAHREVLDELHMQISGRDAMRLAIHALLVANNEDAIADAISAYPILLTDAAQDALSELAAEAGAQADAALAERARACQTLLQTVRAGLVDDH